MEISKDKVKELFSIIDEFYKDFDNENAGKLFQREDRVKKNFYGKGQCIWQSFET